MEKSASIILFDHHIYKDIINDSLNIVRNYIKNKNRIVVGGMAIDMALRLKNKKLYDDDEIPDYDFFSYEYHKDAYNIASILIKQLGKSIDISVINALHQTTMRVRVNYFVVADITFVPKKIYDKIPTLYYDNLKFVHPHYQFITQHLSLYSAYSNSPYETVLYRWNKDVERYDMLLNNYPITVNKIDNNLYKNYKISLNIIKNNCITGIVGAIYWLNKAKKMGMEKIEKADQIFFEINQNLSYKSPTNILSLYSLNYIKASKNIENIKNITKFNSILDILPKKLLIELKNYPIKVEIYNYENKLLSAYMDNDIYIANLQNIMSVLLVKHFFYKKNDIYLYYYNICINIIKWASALYLKNKNVKLLPFFPSLESFGKREIGLPVLLHKNIEKHKGPPKYFFNINTREKINKEFYNYNPNENFFIDGSEIKK